MSGEIGKVLREAREARGVELDAVAAVTKIRPRYLEAIEAERWEALPGRAYARGFLRAYAGFLELDPEPLVAELERDLEPDATAGLPDEPIVQPGTVATGLRARGWRALVAVAAVAVAIAGGVALVLSSGGDGSETSPPAVPPSGEEVGEPAEPPAEPEPPDSEPAPVTLRLTATGTVWVCVVDGRDEARVNGETLAEGEERGPIEARRLRMTLGNGAVEASVDGEPIGIPEAAEPLGYELTADGVEELGAEEQPTCG